MLILFNSGSQTPDSLQQAVEQIVETVYRRLRASVFATKNWDGDILNIESQFPNWIQQQCSADSEAFPVIEFFKYYYRWLFDYDEGYGCGFYLEKIRSILDVKQEILQAYADDVFSKQLDFTEYPELVAGFRCFYLLHARDYVNIRGTPTGIEYFIKSIFGAQTANVITINSAEIEIETDVTNTDYQNLIKTLACPYSFNVTFTTP